MAPPQQLTQWVRRRFPKPSVDPEWLGDCYSWILNEKGLDPATQMEDIIKVVNSELLQSNLSDSMQAGTGLPVIPPNENITLHGQPILVEIISMTEIGHSAFSLQNTRQTRMEQADLAGLAEEQEDEDEGPIPKYPRSMLRFQLSDGSTILHAIEYRRLPGLELGVTPLGFKMLLKGVLVRRGIAYLEPKNVILLGEQTAEHEAMQDHYFVQGLRLRLGLPEEDPPPLPAAVNEPPEPPPAPVPAEQAQAAPIPARTAAQPPPAQVARSPFRELSDPPDGPGPAHEHDDDMDQPRRRKVPVRPRSPSLPPPAQARPTHSRYFSAGPSNGKGKERATGEGFSGDRGRAVNVDLTREMLVLSPHRRSPIVIVSDDEDDPMDAVPLRAPAFRNDNSTRAVAAFNAEAEIPRPGRRSPDTCSDLYYDEINDEMLAEAVKIEEWALSQGGAQPQPHVVENLTQPSMASSTAVASPTWRAGTSTQATARQPARIDLGVITIDDDDDDKENVPVPKRRVRRRTAMPSSAPAEDIIEILD